MTKRGRGNKSSKAEVAKRREKLLELAITGTTTQKEQALQVGRSSAAISRDWIAIQQISPERIAARREQFATELDAMKRFVLEEAKLSDSQMIDAWLSIVDRAAKLFGLDAPTRSVNVNVEADLDKLVGYRKFVVATRHLDEEQMSSVYAFISSIPEKPQVELTIPDVDLDALQLKGETECES
jgi:hypothetical protein